MSRLSISKELLNPVTYLQKGHSSSPIYELTLRKVVLVVVLIFAIGLVIREIVQNLKSSRCTDLTPSRRASEPPLAPRPENRVVEIKPGEEFPLLDLPDELILRVFSCLNPKELLTLELVSKRVQVLASDNCLWKPLVMHQWEGFPEKAEKSWKQIYQETYEGPKTALTKSCKVQDFYGQHREIKFGDRSTCQHLKLHICVEYGLSLETNIILQVAGAVPKDNELVKDIAYTNERQARVINFLARLELCSKTQDSNLEAQKPIILDLLRQLDTA